MAHALRCAWRNLNGEDEMRREIRGMALAIAAATMMGAGACSNSGYEEGSNAPGQEHVGSGDAGNAAGGQPGTAATAGGQVNTGTAPGAAGQANQPAGDSLRAGATGAAPAPASTRQP